MNDGTSHGAGSSGSFCGDGRERELTKGERKRCEGIERCEKRSGKEQVMNDDCAYVS